MLPSPLNHPPSVPPTGRSPPPIVGCSVLGRGAEPLGGLMDDESKVHALLKMTRHKAPHSGVTHRKPLGSAKATDPKELLLAPRVGSSKGHCRVLQS